jgi:hypothetical protein
MDPGYVKLSATPEEKKAVVLELASIGRLSPRDYCVTCGVLNI